MPYILKLDEPDSYKDLHCENCGRSLNKIKNFKRYKHINKGTNKTHIFCSLYCKSQWCYKQARKKFLKLF